MQEAVPRSGRTWPVRSFELATLIASVRAWRIPNAALAATLPALGELSLLFAWTLVITRPYLNFDPMVVPAGREYLSDIRSHHLWIRAEQCGWCALWNGSEQGGSPAFADPHGSMLRPLVIVTTLWWGVVNGSKASLVGAFFMGGVAQWWLGRELGLTRLARLWSAAIAVAAGHLSARMELGAFGIVLSTAACALALPPLVALCRAPTRRHAAMLGAVLGLALVAGQGYMQLGLVAVLPVVVCLLPIERARLLLFVRRFALAAGIALLLAGPLLVPLLHFLPNFGKDTDPVFASAQPFAYIPLNLVIGDVKYYMSDSLQKLPYPYLYAHYIGWIPVLLALYGLHTALATNSRRREALFLAALALLALWIASAAPLRWLTAHLAPNSLVSQQVAGLRHPALIAGLAIPPLLALAGFGLDRLIRSKWPQLNLSIAGSGAAAQASQSGGATASLHVSWLLALPIILSLADVQAFSKHWIATIRQVDVAQVLEALRTPTLEWVNSPFGEQYWIEPAIAMSLKLNNVAQSGHWNGHAPPDPLLEANRAGPPPGMALKMEIAGVPIYAPENPVVAAEREYATVRSAAGQLTICEAHGLGGDIDVGCAAPQAGLLTVKENSWTGWHVAIDGRPATLKPGRWLAVDLPAGSHTITFRYRPWDVPLGLALLMAGMALTLWCWLDRGPPAPAVQPRAEEHRAPATMADTSSPAASPSESELITT